MPFINHMRQSGGKGPRTFEELHCHPFFVPDFRVGDTAALLDELNAKGSLGLEVALAKVTALTGQRQGEHTCHNGKHRQRDLHHSLTHNGQHRQSDVYGGLT
jgi:hypothetical protein